MKPLEMFLDTYNRLNADNLHLLDDVYSEDIRFTDPVHEVEGLEHLKDYFTALYQNVDSVAFDFGPARQVDNQAFIQWKMHLKHPRLASGSSIAVDGISTLQFNEDGKVAHHRDYFDLGAMLYENVPVLGSVIKALKRRLGS